MQYLKDIITVVKLVLTKETARVLTVQRYPELSTKFVLEQCLRDEETIKFIPEHWTKPKARVSREFLWVVLASIQPDYVKLVVDHAYKQRVVSD